MCFLSALQRWGQVATLVCHGFGGQHWAFRRAEEKNVPPDTLLGMVWFPVELEVKALDFDWGQVMLSRS